MVSFSIFHTIKNGLPFWAMLEILLDLKTEQDILTPTCYASNAHHRAKKNQGCFLKRDQLCCNKLANLLQIWCSLARGENWRGLVLLRLAWFLVDTNLTQAMEETHFCHPWARTTMKHKGYEWFLRYWKFLLAHVAQLAHLLKPLSDESGKMTFCWTQKWISI